MIVDVLLYDRNRYATIDTTQIESVVDHGGWHGSTVQMKTGTRFSLAAGEAERLKLLWQGRK